MCVTMLQRTLRLRSVEWRQVGHIDKQFESTSTVMYTNIYLCIKTQRLGKVLTFCFRVKRSHTLPPFHDPCRADLALVHKNKLISIVQAYQRRLPEMNRIVFCTAMLWASSSWSTSSSTVVFGLPVIESTPRRYTRGQKDDAAQVGIRKLPMSKCVEIVMFHGLRRLLMPILVPEPPSGGGSGSSSSGSSGSSGGNSGGYIGCLGYSTYQLQYAWIFPSSPPPCEYVHHTTNGTVSNGGSNVNGTNVTSSGGEYDAEGSVEEEEEEAQDIETEYAEGQDEAENNENIEEAQEEEDVEQEEDMDDREGGEEVEGGDEEQQDNDAAGNEANDHAEDGEDEVDEAVDESDEDTVVTNEDFPDVTSDADQEENGDQGDQEEANENNNGDQYDPYVDFSIEKCDTYENLWLWDLSLTCESETSLDSCQCSFAEELMLLGVISCADASLCPADCEICHTCLRLLGCAVSTTNINSNTTTLVASPYIYVLGAAAGLVIAVVGYYTISRRRRDRSNDLGAHLVDSVSPFDDSYDDEPSPRSGQYEWPLVKASEPKIAAAAAREPTIWLAPDVPQFGPSTRAALESSGESDDAYSTSQGAVGGLTSSSRDEEDPDTNPEGTVWLAPVI